MSAGMKRWDFMGNLYPCDLKMAQFGLHIWLPYAHAEAPQAALGFSETIVDIRKIRPTMTEEIETSGHDELELLYNWLEELLLRFEIDRLVFGGCPLNPLPRKMRLPFPFRIKIGQGGWRDLSKRNSPEEISS